MSINFQDDLRRTKQQMQEAAQRTQAEDARAIEKAQREYGNTNDYNYNKEFTKLAHQFGFGLSSADLKRGYRPLDNQTYSSLRRQASYAISQPDSLNFGDYLYDPWAHDHTYNKDVADYFKEYKKAPTDAEDFGKFQTRRQYKGQYANTIEDQANEQAGLKPIRFQYDDKIDAELKAIQEAANAGKLNPQNIWTIAPTMKEINDWTIEQAQKAQDAADSGERSWSWEGTKSTKSGLDTDYLKKIGWDPTNGFQSVYNKYVPNPLQLVPGEQAPPFTQTPSSAPGEQIPPPSGRGKTQQTSGAMVPGEQLPPANWGGQTVSAEQRTGAPPGFEDAIEKIADSNPAIRRKMDEGKTLPERLQENYNKSLITEEQYVNAVENKDTATIERFQKQFRPTAPRFTDDQLKRIAKASSIWKDAPEWAKSSMAFALGVSDALTTPIPIPDSVAKSIFGENTTFDSNMAVMALKNAAAHGDLTAKKKLMDMDLMRESDPFAYNLGQVASMAVPIYGVEAGVSKATARAATEEMARLAPRTVAREAQAAADMAKLRDIYRFGTPAEKEAALVRTTQGMPSAEAAAIREAIVESLKGKTPDELTTPARTIGGVRELPRVVGPGEASATNATRLSELSPRTEYRPDGEFIVQRGSTTPRNATGATDDIRGDIVYSSNSVPDGAGTRLYSSVVTEDDLARQLDDIERYNPEEHVSHYRSESGKWQYQLTDIDGNVLAKYSDRGRALQGAERYKQGLYNAVSEITPGSPMPYAASEQKLLSAPREPIASDSLGNTLRYRAQADFYGSPYGTVSNRPGEQLMLPAGEPAVPAPRQIPERWARDDFTDGAEAPGAGTPTPQMRGSTIGAPETTRGGYMAQAVEDDMTLTGKPTQYTADVAAGGADPSQPPAQAFRKGEQKMSFTQKLKQYYRNTVDPNQGLKSVGDDAYKSAISSKNAGTQASNIMDRQLVNRQGARIGDSLEKTLTDNLPAGQETEFWEYALQRHNVARAGEGKPIFSQLTGDGKEVFFSPDESAQRVAMLNAQHPDWAAKADNITGWINKFMEEWGVKSGLVSKEKWAELLEKYPDYLPTNRYFDDLEDLVQTSGTAKGFVDQNGLRVATGSKRDIIDPTENIINLVNRTVRSARKNEVGQLVVEACKKNPKMAEYAKIIPPKEGMFAKTDDIVQVLVDGKPVYVKLLNADLRDTMLALNAADSMPGISKITNIFKNLVTTKNPFFAVRNVARDVPTYLINSQAGPIRAVKNLGRAGGEIIASDLYNPIARKLGLKEFETPMLDTYRGLGGEGSNFIGQSTARTAEQITGKRAILNKAGEITGYKDIGKIQKIAAAIGEKVQDLNAAFETAPRYAEFLNAVDKGKSLENAIYDAAEITTNFSRGGKTLKKADAYIPYLNASVQGLARVGRVLNPAHPAQAIAALMKGGLAITVPTAALMLINKDNPNYKDLDNKTKDNYFLIPNWGNLDANGQAKTFIKIPKSREYGVLFGSLFERVFRATNGDSEAFKGLGESAVSNIAPNNPLNSNILYPGFAALTGINKDWAGRDIEPASMQGRSPHLRYDEKTSEISKWFTGALHDVAGIEWSPKYVDYLIKSYTGVIGQIGLPLATKSTYSGSNPAMKALQPATSQFTSDPLYNNQTINDFYDEMDRLNTIAKDKNFTEDLPGEITTAEERRYSAMTKASKAISELSKQINDTNDPASVRKYMIAIAKNAIRQVKNDFPYVPPIKVAQKDSNGHNKTDSTGAVIYKYLGQADYFAYQRKLEELYRVVVNGESYKMLDQKHKAEMLQKRMEKIYSNLDKMFLSGSLK